MFKDPQVLGTGKIHVLSGMASLAVIGEEGLGA